MASNEKDNSVFSQFLSIRVMHDVWFNQTKIKEWSYLIGAIYIFLYQWEIQAAQRGETVWSL